MAKNLLVLLFTLLGLFVAGELTVRLLQRQDVIQDFSRGDHARGVGKEETFSPKFVRSDNPTLFIEHDVSDPAINSHGMRGPEVDLAKTTGTYRIALIGDSVTYGYGVSLENTYGHLLEQRLNEGSERRYEVLNFGVSGYGIEAYVEQYRTKVRRFSPDMVIVGFCLNDPVPANVVFEAVGDVMLKNASYTKIGKWSELLAWVKYRIDQILEARKIEDKFAELIYDDETIELLSEQFRELKSLIHQDGAELLVAIFPYFIDFDSENLRSIHGKLHGILGRLSIPYIDTSTAFAEKPPEHWRLNPRDTTHPNVLGHRLIADVLSREMTD